MAIATRYRLEDFVGDMQDLVNAQPDEQSVFEKGARYLERLCANPDALPEKYRLPCPTGRNGNHGSYALYRGPGLFISAVVWGPGDHIGPHDHKTWGMIGVGGNAIRETRYRRVDDRDRDDVAHLERDRAAILKPGEISLLLPEVDEIHAMDNDSDRPTWEIHVYGKDLVGLPRCAYNLDSGAVKWFKSAPFDNC
jgi:predicted metal-dependent enzyme (double-stranded beta helix superfamily)